MNFPRSVKSFDKLQYMLECVRSMTPESKPFRVLLYTPWSKAAKKIKGYDCRINLFDLPEAFSILREEVKLSSEHLNYVPTLLTFTVNTDGLLVQVNDNPSAIQYELGSRG